MDGQAHATAKGFKGAMGMFCTALDADWEKEMGLGGSCFIFVLGQKLKQQVNCVINISMTGLQSTMDSLPGVLGEHLYQNIFVVLGG